MSSDWFEAWWYGGDAYDRRTREVMAEQAAQEARARSRLQDQLRKQSGDLQAQIDRLTQAFVALVDYEDVRGELNQYADAAAVRRYAREVVAGLVMTGGTGLAGVPVPADVRGYWLAAAAHGVALTAKGATAEADELLAEAVARDRRRTATFLVLLDALSREPRWADRHLDAVLPASTDVTVAQRVLWTAIADGRLGDGARTRLQTTLASAAGRVDASVVDAWLAARVTGTPARAVPAESATAALGTLRAVVTGTPATGEPAPPASPASLRQGRTAAEPATPASEDPLADCVMTLVDQGAPGEAEVLARMEEARAAMGFVQPRSKERDWDAPAGAVVDLLLADLTDDTAPGRRDLARSVLAPLLSGCADRLLQLAREPAPAETTVRLARVDPIVVAMSGAADEGWRDRVAEATARAYPVDPWRRPGAIAAGVVAALGLVLMLADPVFAVVALAGAAGAGFLLHTDHRQRRERSGAVASALRRGETDVRAAVDRLADETARASAAATAASGHHAAIRDALA